MHTILMICNVFQLTNNAIMYNITNIKIYNNYNLILLILLQIVNRITVKHFMRFN